MDALTTFLQTLNNLSPLAVIGLLGTIIFMLVKGKTMAARKVQEVKSNDLHELPEIAETLRSMNHTLQRMEVKMGEEFSYIKARINGKQ